MDLIEKALRVAVVAHKEQLRKTDGSPYVVHPVMVARIVEAVGGDEIAIAAALVHDVLEDTAVSATELSEILGEEVVAVVVAVSEDKSLPWRERKQQYIEDVAAADERTRLVSVADKIHNAKSLLDFHAEHGAAAWEKFNKGKDEKVWFEKALHEHLAKQWQHPILEEYKSLIDQLEELD